MGLGRENATAVPKRKSAELLGKAARTVDTNQGKENLAGQHVFCAASFAAIKRQGAAQALA